MAGARSPQPLFELLAKSQSDALSRQAKSFIPPGGDGHEKPEPQVAAVNTVADSPPVVARPTESRAAAMPPELATRGRPGSVEIPLIWVYVGCAGLIALLVLVWTIAYGRGGVAREAEWQELMASRGDPIVADPLGLSGTPSGSPATGSAPTGPEPSRGGSQRPERPSGGGVLPGATRFGVLSSAGVLPTDPRQPGRNYLMLASLGRADAEQAITFLGSSGVEAIGAPVVDPKGGSANNPARYEVFAAVGITGEEYKNNRPVRTELEAKVARIGERFRREAKGPTDFAKPLWIKYNP